MGAFTCANFNAVNTLNREFDRRKEDIRKLKEELEQIKREHEAHIANLMKTSQDKYNEVQVKNVSLQDELQYENTANVTLMQRIALLEKQCEDATISVTYLCSLGFHNKNLKNWLLKQIRSITI